MRGCSLTTLTPAAAASREAQVTMGVYRLTIPETIQESLKPDACKGSNSFKSQRQRFLMEDSYCAHPSPKPSRFFEAPLHVIPSTTSLEAPDLEHFSELDDGSSTSSVFSSSSTRTSHTISDDDSLLMELVSRTSSLDGVFFAAPKRHSTACCADGAFRREQRKRQVREESNNAVDEQRDTGLHSFRRELEREDDRVDRSLALWEDTEYDRQPRRKGANVHPAPPSCHAGDMTASAGSRRNKKKNNSATASFFNGLFSGLNLSTSRRSRKSSS